MYTSKDLRYRTKEILDTAQKGEPVSIIRGKEKFVLRRDETDSTIQMIIKRLKALEDAVYHPKQSPALTQAPSTSLTPQPMPNINPNPTAGELPCCLNDRKRCQHWVFTDTDPDKVINTLSGRMKPVENWGA